MRKRGTLSIVKQENSTDILARLARRNEYQLNDSAEVRSSSLYCALDAPRVSDFHIIAITFPSFQYFFENVERITNPHYTPTDNDILRCRGETLPQYYCILLHLLLA